METPTNTALPERIYIDVAEDLNRFYVEAQVTGQEGLNRLIRALEFHRRKYQPPIDTGFC
jgi:hypothetical protein